jgi:hypothetical protein
MEAAVRGPRFAAGAAWLALVISLGALVTGCEPTGPTPVQLRVPTAVRETMTLVVPTATPPPTLTASPVPSLSATEEPVQQTATPTPPPLVVGEGWQTLTHTPGGRALTPSVDRDSVMWVAPAGPGLGLYLLDLRTGSTQLVAEPATPGGCVCEAHKRGNWIAVVETAPGATWWEVTALNLDTEEEVPVGRTDDPAVPMLPEPGGVVVNADGQVVWQDVTSDAAGSVTMTLRRFDTATSTQADIITVRSPVQITGMDMYGDWVVWSQATESEAGTRGDVFAYNLQSDELSPIGETGRAWEPSVWGATVAWMQADGPFADGDVLLFHLTTGEAEVLTDDGQVSGVGVGDGFVVWSSASQGVVVRREFDAESSETIGRGTVGWLAAAGNVVVWLLDEDPETLHVAWRQ